jgi:hypothetical protein
MVVKTLIGEHPLLVTFPFSARLCFRVEYVLTTTLENLVKTVGHLDVRRNIVFVPPNLNRLVHHINLRPLQPTHFVVSHSSIKQRDEHIMNLVSEHLYIEAKIEKVDERQREDSKSLEVKNDKWQEEVRDEFTAVKTRLTTIETKLETKDAVKKNGWHAIGVWVAIVISILAIIFKAS